LNVATWLLFTSDIEVSPLILEVAERVQGRKLLESGTIVVYVGYSRIRRYGPPTRLLEPKHGVPDPAVCLWG
jgi:hypothetical protein